MKAFSIKKEPFRGSAAVTFQNGHVVGTTGALAIGGYIINAPLLYYFIEGRNSTMAFHTAILFVLFGTGLLCLSD